jgi:hypothetical protein
VSRTGRPDRVEGVMKLEDIEMAFEFVSSAHPFEHTVLVSRSTGETYWRSGLADEDDLPEGYEGDDDLVEIPHENDLDLGQRLVWQFVDQEMPRDRDRVSDIFSRRGAYRRYKDLLERKGLLERWYEFEDARTKEALREWCKDDGITLDE